MGKEAGVMRLWLRVEARAREVLRREDMVVVVGDEVRGARVGGA